MLDFLAGWPAAFRPAAAGGSAAAATATTRLVRRRRIFLGFFLALFWLLALGQRSDLRRHEDRREVVHVRVFLSHRGDQRGEVLVLVAITGLGERLVQHFGIDLVDDLRNLVINVLAHALTQLFFFLAQLLRLLRLRSRLFRCGFPCLPLRLSLLACLAHALRRALGALLLHGLLRLFFSRGFSSFFDRFFGGLRSIGRGCSRVGVLGGGLLGSFGGGHEDVDKLAHLFRRQCGLCGLLDSHLRELGHQFLGSHAHLLGQGIKAGLGRECLAVNPRYSRSQRRFNTFFFCFLLGCHQWLIS